MYDLDWEDVRKYCPGREFGVSKEAAVKQVIALLYVATAIFFQCWIYVPHLCIYA